MSWLGAGASRVAPRDLRGVEADEMEDHLGGLRYFD
jgi:hypothetical protein